MARVAFSEAEKSRRDGASDARVAFANKRLLQLWLLCVPVVVFPFAASARAERQRFHSRSPFVEWVFSEAEAAQGSAARLVRPTLPAEAPGERVEEQDGEGVFPPLRYASGEEALSH